MHLVQKMTHLNVLKPDDFVGSFSEPVGNTTDLWVWLCEFESCIGHFLFLFFLKII